MIFYRHRVDSLDLEKLRTLASRSGWLIETTEALRAGFGRAVVEISLTEGLNGSLGNVAPFLGSTVSGDPAPSHVGPTAFSSVPFDRNGAIRIWIPEHVVTIIGETTWLTSVDADPTSALDIIQAVHDVDVQNEYDVVATTYAPTPDGYARSVATAVEELRHSELEKVVLARRVQGSCSSEIDPAVVAGRLHVREPACTLYAFPALENGRFVGASPELLIASSDGAVAAHPLAGTVALPEDAESNEYSQWLMGSNKNLYEHSLVVDDIVQRLATKCSEVRADSKPTIVTLRSVAHLGTWIYGKIGEQSPASVLELLGLVHPTAAVGGIPQDRALKTIERLESQDRGLYAGSIGWFDAEGNGEWWLAIRGVVVDGSEFTAWAGAGIVADSEPISEREETRDKLASILVGLGTVRN